MADLAFDIYPADSPRNGSLLVRLTKADFLSGTTYRSVLRGASGGVIVLHSEHAAVQAGHLSPDNYVRVIDLGYDQIIGGFFLAEGEETVLSRQEQGGEVRSYGGPGTIAYLGRATFPTTLRSDADASLAEHQAYMDSTGYMRFGGPETYGGILGRLIYEARLDVPDAVPELPAHDWDDGVDSGGTSWSVFTGYYDVKVGDNLLERANDLMKKGIDLFLDPHTFEPTAYLAGTYGTDRTSTTFASGKVRFAAGVNISSDLDRALHRLSYCSHLLVVGADGVTWLEYVDPDWSSGETVYRHTLRLDTTNDLTIMEEAAAEYVRERKLREDEAKFPIIPGGDPDNGFYAAGIHFAVGDLVTLHSGTGEHDYDNQSIQVAAIAWNQHDNGTFIPSVELGSQYASVSTSVDNRKQTTQAGDHTHGPNPRLCDPTIEPSEATVEHEWLLDADGFDTATGTFEAPTPAFGQFAGGYLEADGFDTGGIALTSPFPPMTAGVSYGVEALIRSDEGEGPVSLQLQWYSGSGGSGLLQTDVIGSTTAGTVTNTIVAPGTGTVYVKWAVIRSGGPANNNLAVGLVRFTTGEDSEGSNPLAGTSPLAARCDHGHDYADPDHTHEGVGEHDHDTDYAVIAHTHEPGLDTGAGFSAALVHRVGTTQAVPDQVNTPLIFGTEEVDTDDYWDAGSPTQFTMPADGLYEFWGETRIQGGGGQFRYARFRIDGGPDVSSKYFGGSHFAAISGAASTNVEASGKAYLLAGQTVEFVLYQNSGGDLNVPSDTGTYSRFFVRRIQDGTGGTSADDTHAWMPVLDDDGAIVTDSNGSPVMGYGPL